MDRVSWVRRGFQKYKVPGEQLRLLADDADNDGGVDDVDDDANGD